MPIAYRINVCTATACHSSGSEQIKDRLAGEAKARGIARRCLIAGVGCRGLCTNGPMVGVDPDGLLYQHVTLDDVADILDSLGGRPVERIQAHTGDPFFARQRRIVLENSGEIEPERIESTSPPAATRRSTQVAPRDDARRRSSRRSRERPARPRRRRLPDRPEVGDRRQEPAATASSSSATPTRATPARSWTAASWRATRTASSKAWRSPPTRSAPARATSTSAASTRWPIQPAARRPSSQAKQLGLLGEQIFESPFDFRVDLRIGAGAFVCGEETALMASIEGRRGTPAPAPALPRRGGPLGLPDADQQRRDVRQHRRRSSATAPTGSPRIGTEKSKGTKVFALAGKVRNTGLIEVPMGTTLREIVEEIGGGVPDGGTIKAVQTGGPSGGCIPAEHLDTPVDYESLPQARLDHGLGRHDRHGRDHQHGRRGPLLHGVLHGRVVRQVHPLPRRHGADAPAARRGSPRARRRRPTWRGSRSCATWSSTPACAAWASRPRTRS